MGIREGRGPRTLTLVIVTSLLLSLVPVSPALAIDTDLVYTPPIGWAIQTTSPPANARDANDTTFTIATICGNQTIHSITQVACLWAATWDRSSGVTALDIERFRILTKACNGGYPYTVTCGGSAVVTHLLIERKTDTEGGCSSTAGLGVELYYGSPNATTTYDSGIIELDTSLTYVDASPTGTQDVICVWVQETGAGDVLLNSLSFYEPAAPSEVDITDYLYNLVAYHPPFIRRFTWEWIADPVWSGTWALTDSDDTIIAGSFRPGFNHIEQVDINCPIVCGDDTYLITVNDATNNRVAYYEIDGDATGQLVSDIQAPRLTGVTQFCYQATTAQCDAVVDTVGLVKVVYTFVGTADYSYDIAAGQLSGTNAAPSMMGSVTSGSHVPGSYTLFIDVMDTDGPPYAVLLITAGSGGRTYTVGGPLDFGGGGIVTTVEPPPPGDGPISCGQFDVVCGLRSLFSIAASTVIAAFNVAYQGLISRQPFAFLFGTATAASAQIARAQASVSSSDDCAGVHFTMPTLPPVSYHAFGADKTANPKYYAFSGNTPTATPFVFSALRCEDLEPWGGTDWWQGLRTIMGPALVMGYAFQLFRRYEVKPQLGG